MRTPLWIMLLTPALIAGCLSAPQPRPAPDTLRPLIEAINQRLDIANDVALSKWYSGKPVQDTDRERQVILNAESQAATFKLEKDDVRPFMTAQIEANKVVQYGRMAQWRDDIKPPQEPPLSLTQDIRTRLDKLQPVLMEKYAAFVPDRGDSACPSWVQTEIQRQATDSVMLSALQRATADLCAVHSKS